MTFYVGLKELREEATNPTEQDLMIPFVQIILSILIFFYFWSKYRKKLKDETVKINENSIS
jgi:biopolymer transport protein ExbD